MLDGGIGIEHGSCAPHNFPTTFFRCMMEVDDLRLSNTLGMIQCTQASSYNYKVLVIVKD